MGTYKTNLTCLIFPKEIEGAFCVGGADIPTIYPPFLTLIYQLSKYPSEQSMPRQPERTLSVNWSAPCYPAFDYAIKNSSPFLFGALASSTGASQK